MKKSRTTVIILAMLAAVLLLYFYFGNDRKHYVWVETYRADSREPYGTFFIHKMLEGYRNGGQFIMSDTKPLRKTLSEIDTPEKTDYVFIGQTIFLDEANARALAQFVEAGGNAFIASAIPPETLLETVYSLECGAPFHYATVRHDSVRLNFFDTAARANGGYEYRYRVVDRDYPYNWSYVTDSVFCDATASVLPIGYQQGGQVNFVRLPVGKGSLYLHTTPLVFTNYFTAKSDYLDYISGVFSHLSGEDIVWDEYSKIPLVAGNSFNSPLYYFLQQPALKYAWWLLLVSVILYTVFAAKRRQRIIPVLEPKTNTSLEFVNLIARLHYKNGDHLDMARKKMKYFLYFVRSRYGIHVEKVGDEHVRRLAGKSGVREEDVRAIFSQYELIDSKFRDDIEVSRLVNLYDSIEYFYSQCK